MAMRTQDGQVRHGAVKIAGEGAQLAVDRKQAIGIGEAHDAERSAIFDTGVRYARQPIVSKRNLF